MAITMDLPTSIRKHNNELKVHEKTGWTIIKEHPYPYCYAVWVVLENKTNATSHPNIGSLKTVFWEEYIKISKEFFFHHANRFEDVLIQYLQRNDGHFE